MAIFFSRLLKPAAALWFFMQVAACAEPCRDLALKVCACEPVELQARCKSDVETAQSQTDISSTQADQCGALLEICTCEALQQGEGNKCGLTR